MLQFENVIAIIEQNRSEATVLQQYLEGNALT